MISNIILYFICQYKTLNFIIWKLKVVISGYQNALKFVFYLNFFSSVDWYYKFILKLGKITPMIKYSYFQISKVYQYSFYFTFYANSYNVLWKARPPSKWRKNRIKNIFFFNLPPPPKKYRYPLVFFTVFNFYASKTFIRRCKCTVLYRNAQKRAKRIKACRLTEISVGLGNT